MTTPTPTTRAGAALLACALALAALVALPTAAEAQEPFGLDLEGEYRMITGEDDPSFAEPDFDDSSWVTTTVPTDDGHEGVWDDFDGIGWFRRSFDLPAAADGLNLVLSAGFMDDADETFINGQLVGRSGEFSGSENGSDSQWFERRLYPVPEGVLNFGGSNVIAVRVDDFSGGGGWYEGPVGIFSKERLREEVYEVFSTPAPSTFDAGVRNVLSTQAAALAAGDVDAYMATLDDAFFHDGDDLDRRRRDLTGFLAQHDTLELVDGEVEVILTTDGRLLADTNRSIVGVTGDTRVEIQPPTQEFLRFDPTGFAELGNYSRFFRDTVFSELEGGNNREFVVYLPPSYFANPDHEYPITYMFHGINGGAREWEPRNFDALLDELFTTGGLAEQIVIFPDGESLWYWDGNVPWRSMFLQEMMPLIEAEFRTLQQREFRGTSGVSMGGHGSFTISWDNPDLFSSITSHMGALSLPPLSGGSTTDAAAETPLVQVTTHDPFFLQSYSYFFDACVDDDFRFGEAVHAMSGQLTAKLTDHTAIVYPEGRHNDDCWLPHIDASFGSHSDHFRANGLVEPPNPPPAAPTSTPAPTPTSTPDPAPAATPTPDAAPAATPAATNAQATGTPMPTTGGGATVLALLALLVGATLRTRRSTARSTSS